MRQTALKAYIDQQGISIKEIARECSISESYISKIVNNRANTANKSILKTLADYLGLSIAQFNRLLDESNNKHTDMLVDVTKKRNNVEFLGYLNKILDSLDMDDHDKELKYSAKIKELDINNINLYANYIHWNAGRNLELEDKFGGAIRYFLQAQSFEARNRVEMRFKGRILGGLGEALIAKGHYAEAMKALRQSLMSWDDEGMQTGWIYLNMGILYRRKGDIYHAMNAYEKAEDMGNASVQNSALSALILIAMDMNQERQARELIADVYQRIKTAGTYNGKGDLCCKIGKLFLEQEKFKMAEIFFNSAVHHAILEKKLRIKHYAMIGLANVYMQIDAKNNFRIIMDKLESEVTLDADCLILCKKLNLLGYNYIINNQIKKAKAVLCESYKIAFQAKLSHELICSCQGLEKCYTALHEPSNVDFYNKEKAKAKRLIRIK